MFKGRYRLEDKEGNPLTSWTDNFITDKGYEFWTKYNVQLGSNPIDSIAYSSDKAAVVNLKPSTDIERLQGRLSTDTITNITASMEKSETSAKIVNTFKSSVAPTYAEIGLVSGTDLYTYSIPTDDEALEVIPRKAILSYQVSIIIPEISRIYSVNIADTTYKLKVDLKDDFNESKSLERPFQFNASLTNESISVDCEVTLGSYNKETKEVTYNITVPYTASVIGSKTAKVVLDSSLGLYHITLLSNADNSPAAYPETSAKDIIIPFKIQL